MKKVFFLAMLINIVLTVKAQDCSDPMFTTYTREHKDISCMNIFIGDNGKKGSNLSVPVNSRVDYLAIRVLNNKTHSNSIKHLFGSDGSVHHAGNLIVDGTITCQSICGGDYLPLTGGKVTGNVSVVGKIGIGTTKPDSLLTVNGAIHAREVVVDLKVPADFVFGKDYSLMPLQKVEKYVQTNNHLPDLPSASEIKQQGLNVGEIQNKLLQKIEELTLYAIEQNKQITQQNQKIEKLEEEIEEMKK